jgi:hypothetical protein
MEADMVITIALVAGVVLVVNQLGRILRAFSMQKTVRQALTRDGAVTPELLDRLDEKEPRRLGEDRLALVLIALALALIGYGLVQGDADDIRNLVGIALFPGFVGAALLARLWYRKHHGAGA